MAKGLRKFAVPPKAIPNADRPVFVTGFNVEDARALLVSALMDAAERAGDVFVVTPGLLDLKEVEFTNPEVR